MTVLVGAYLISIDAKNKMERERKEKMKKELVEGDPEAAVLTINFDEKQPSKDFFLVDLAKSIWQFKAGLYIMGVSLLW